MLGIATYIKKYWNFRAIISDLDDKSVLKGVSGFAKDEGYVKMSVVINGFSNQSTS